MSWNILTGRPKAGNDWTKINSLDQSPKGDVAATSGVGVQIWNLDQMGKRHLLKFSFANPTKLDLAVQATRSNNDPWVHVFEFYAVRFSKDGSQVFAGDALGRINIGDPYTGRELASWQGHEGAVLS